MNTNNGNRAGHKAVILDPHPFCHGAIGSLLARLGISVAGATTSTDVALALVDQHEPELLVADLDVPGGTSEGLSCLTQARKRVPTLAAIVFSGRNDSHLVEEAFQAGASAYVLKTTNPDDVLAAIRQAFDKSIYLASDRSLPKARPASPTADPVPRLTRRELEILQLVADGRSNRQVAQLLWVTDQTVKFHLANIYRKLGVKGRWEAARWAREHGVLEVAESGEMVTIAEGEEQLDNGDAGPQRKLMPKA